MAGDDDQQQQHDPNNKEPPSTDAIDRMLLLMRQNQQMLENFLSNIISDGASTSGTAPAAATTPGPAKSTRTQKRGRGRKPTAVDESPARAKPITREDIRNYFEKHVRQSQTQQEQGLPPQPMDPANLVPDNESSDDEPSSASSSENDSDERTTVPSSGKKFRSFYRTVHAALSASKFATNRELHEVATLRHYSEAWPCLSSRAKREVCQRLQLLELVAQFGWGVALKLGPSGTSLSKYSVKIDAQALLLAQQVAASARGQFQRNQQQQYQPAQRQQRFQPSLMQPGTSGAANPTRRRKSKTSGLPPPQ